ncbi:MAG: DUF3788 domain-containing protein [Bacteroidia bacterium]
MEDSSIFQDKSITPDETDLAHALADTYPLWTEIRDMVVELYPEGFAEWNYPGKKYGWSYRIKDKKRVIIYFLPREGYFKVAFVFGQKAFDAIMESSVSTEIKTSLENATKYAEGRGIRIDIMNKTILPDIRKLIEIKLNN